MEAGYLRTEQEALGIHDDIGVAEEVSSRIPSAPAHRHYSFPLSIFSG